MWVIVSSELLPELLELDLPAIEKVIAIVNKGCAAREVKLVCLKDKIQSLESDPPTLAEEPKSTLDDLKGQLVKDGDDLTSLKQRISLYEQMVSDLNSAIATLEESQPKAIHDLEQEVVRCSALLRTTIEKSGLPPALNLSAPSVLGLNVQREERTLEADADSERRPRFQTVWTGYTALKNALAELIQIISPGAESESTQSLCPSQDLALTFPPATAPENVTATEVVQPPAVEPNYHVRWLIRSDLPVVLGIESKSFEFPWSEEEFIQCLRARDCIGLVAELENKVVGFVFYEIHTTTFHVLSIAVDPEFRRKGVGAAMLDKLVAKLQPQRRNELVLEVRESNLDAQLFLKNRGFRATTVLNNCYVDSDEAAFSMVYRLPDANNGTGQTGAQEGQYSIQKSTRRAELH